MVSTVRGPHTPSEQIASTSPLISETPRENSICGGWLPPRQLKMRLRPGCTAAASASSRPWSSISWTREWSRVWAASLPLRIM